MWANGVLKHTYEDVGSHSGDLERVMKLIETSKHRGFFKVMSSTREAQAAMMVLRPGQTTGEPQNEHPWAQQWLFVISGSGRAKVGHRWISLKANSLLIIEKGEVHQIKNSGRRALVTLNIYVPPAYRGDGELRRPSIR
jgi:mannose-6-phosphate isomerase-like protein (cupin superfamily)